VSAAVIDHDPGVIAGTAEGPGAPGPIETNRNGPVFLPH